MVKPTRVEGLDDVQKILEKIPEVIFVNAKKTLASYVLSTQAEITQSFNRDPSTSLQTRTGNLQRSIDVENSGRKLETLRVSIFTDSIYAPIHEEGGTIRARRAFRNLNGGPYLAIPSDINKTRAGVTRFSPRDAFSIGASIVAIKNPKNAPFMIVDEDIGPLFWLVKEVDIKARLGMVKTTEKNVPALVDDLYDILFEGLE